MAPRGSAVPAGAPAVAFVSSHARRGGSERYLRLLLGELERDWIAGVVCLEDGPLVDDLRRDGLDVHVLETGRRLRDVAAPGLRLGRLVRRFGADVVHANGVKAAVVCAVDPGPARPPLVWVKHDFAGDGRPARLLALRCRRVVAVSSVAAATFTGRLRARVRVIHNGLPPIVPDRAGGRRLLLDALGAPEPAAVVGLVGRLDPEKGQQELAAALPELVERVPGARVAFIGPENALRPEFPRRLRSMLARAGVAEAAAFLGYREDVLELVSGCDVVAIPSIPGERGLGREGFGFVGVEAFAVGTPVVGYADGALPEVLGDCALLVPPGDRAALAEAIVRVLQDPVLRDGLAGCGRARQTECFGLDRMVAALKDEYRAAAGGMQPRPESGAPQ